MSLEKEPQFFGKEGPEKWAEEVPTETFGTEEERKQNFERFIGRLKQEREKEGVSEEEFEERLSRTEQFLENMVLIHSTSLRSVAEIFGSRKIFSLAELQKNRPVTDIVHTFSSDREAGLDQFIFMSSGAKILFGDAVLVMGNEIINRPDCFATAEDIVEIPSRLQDCFPRGEQKNWSGLSRETTPDIWNECLKEYRQQILSGKDFKKFLANFIASYHSHPEDSLRYPTSRDYTIASHDHLYDRSGLGQRVPLFFKKWYRPEIKVKNEIGVENIKFVIV